jgi:dTDP-6-deoxy-L-talose 4-dehydrogenase (NAD+)
LGRGKLDSIEGAETIDVDIFSGSLSIYEELGSPDLLIHLAWRDGFIHNSPEHMKNLSSHVEFLRSYIKGGGKNVAIMGTMHEIGYWEGAVDENTPCNPLSQYGVAKNALRQSLMLAVKELEFNLYWLRAFYIFGDDAHGSSIFAKITHAAEEGKETFPFTTGKNKYDFISINELAKQIIAATTQRDITGIINVCSGKAVSLAKQVEWFIKDRGYSIALKYGAFPDRPYDSPMIWGDNSKIQEILRKN